MNRRKEAFWVRESTLLKKRADESLEEKARYYVEYWTGSGYHTSDPIHLPDLPYKFAKEVESYLREAWRNNRFGGDPLDYQLDPDDVWLLFLSRYEYWVYQDVDYKPELFMLILVPNSDVELKYRIYGDFASYALSQIKHEAANKTPLKEFRRTTSQEDIADAIADEIERRSKGALKAKRSLYGEKVFVRCAFADLDPNAWWVAVEGLDYELNVLYSDMHESDAYRDEGEPPLSEDEIWEIILDHFISQDQIDEWVRSCDEYESEYYDYYYGPEEEPEEEEEKEG